MTKPSNSYKVVALNKRARFEYFIESTFEAGIVLTGSEVKSLRQGKASILESYASEEHGEIYLINAQIQEYKEANQFNHEPKRPRKLLLHKREIKKLSGAIKRKGYTLVPLQLYFNEKGKAKLELGLAKGKDSADKRETIKQRDWQKDKARILRNRG